MVTHTAVAGPGKYLLRINEAAEAVGVGRTSIYELIQRGELETVTIGRSRRIPTEAIEKFVERLRQEAASK